MQQALEAIERAYASAGYAAVRVTLPEQELDQGVVRLRVVEGRIRRLSVEGSRFHDDANVLSGLSGLRSGEVPNALRIESGLKLANENPSKKVQVNLKSAGGEGEIDATVRVADEKTWRAGAVLDNSGSPQTGDWRLALFYQNANLANRDHVLTLSYTTSPDHTGDVSIFGAGYHIPLYTWGDSIDLFAGRADVNTGTVQGLFDVSGKGTLFGARYNRNLVRRGGYEHKLVFGLDWRAYENTVVPAGGGTSLVPDVTVCTP